MTSTMTLEDCVNLVSQMHDQIRDSVVAACENAASAADLAAISHDGSGDTIYAVDRISEQVLIDLIESTLAQSQAVSLIAEGIEPDGQMLIPPQANPDSVQWQLLVDPIDGTRGLMYQKRSAWILTAIAPASASSLQQCAAAVMTEIPLIKQHLCDQLSAIRGQGVHAHRYDRIRKTTHALRIAPSSSTNFEHGFAQLCRFFPGSRDILASIDDEICQQLCGPATPGKALCFEDQYLSTGGQFYELIVGHDRFTADLRPLLQSGGLCCHPYDCAALLIAEEAGVIITDQFGNQLDCPLDISSDVCWVAYANANLQQRIAPVLQQALIKRNLLM